MITNKVVDVQRGCAKVGVMKVQNLQSTSGQSDRTGSELKSRKFWKIGQHFRYEGNAYQFLGYDEATDSWHAIRLFGDKQNVTFSSPREWDLPVNP